MGRPETGQVGRRGRRAVGRALEPTFPAEGVSICFGATLRAAAQP
jgi:hypothetical protein